MVAITNGLYAERREKDGQERKKAGKNTKAKDGRKGRKRITGGKRGCGVVAYFT